MSERNIALGNLTDARTNLEAACDVLKETIERCGIDVRLAEEIVDLAASAITVNPRDSLLDSPVARFASRWDSEFAVLIMSGRSRDIVRKMERYPDLADIFPALWARIDSFSGTSIGAATADDQSDLANEKSIGTVLRVFDAFGFINCPDVGDVYFNIKSLAQGDYWTEFKPGVEVVFDLVRAPKGWMASGLSVRSNQK